MTLSKRHLFLLVAAVGLLFASSVLAASEEDIAFPVAELGACQTEEECRAYCDDASHINECLAFAEQHNLLASDELAKAKKFQELGAVGPGGCRGELECEAHCENITNIQECLAFAEQHGFMDERELAEAQKIAQAVRQGAQLPGGCTNRASCESYCSDLNNMRECLVFGEAAGLIPSEGLKEAKQVLKALEAGVSLPGNCRGELECKAYCEDSRNVEECVEFGIAAGFIPPEEAEDVRRVLPLMKEGKMPGGCREKEECEAYCSAEEHTEECTTFFLEAGFMTAEEAELFRKTGGRGPGGCRGELECEAFCNDPANQEACFTFASEHDLIGEKELANIQEGVGRFKQGLREAPPEVAQCLREQIGQEVLDKIEAGTFLPNPELGEKMRSCFEIQQQAIQEEMRECLSQSCDGFFSCLEGVGGGVGGGALEGTADGSGLESEIEAKVALCTEERFQQQTPAPEEFPEGFEFENGDFPQEFEGQSIEEIERRFREQEEASIRQEIEEQQRLQFEQQFQEQFEEQAPAPEESTGSLFDAVRLFFFQLLGI